MNLQWYLTYDYLLPEQSAAVLNLAACVLVYSMNTTNLLYGMSRSCLVSLSTIDLCRGVDLLVLDSDMV